MDGSFVVNDGTLGKRCQLPPVEWPGRTTSWFSGLNPFLVTAMALI